MENAGLIQVKEVDLKWMIDYFSSSLVGKIMKRFEVIEDKSTLKALCKETIYEESRLLRDLLIAYTKGLQTSIWNFKQKEKE